MISEFGKVFIFLIIGAVFVAGGIITNTIIRPKKPTKEKLSTYECGEEPVGSPWVKFNIRFFVVALIFVLFDVEIVFLFPWAVVLKEMGMMAFWEMGAFLLILIVGFAYVWGKGDLTWQRPAPIIPDMATFVSHQKPRLKPGTPPAPKTEPMTEQAA